MKEIIVIILSYLFGCFSSAYILGKIYKGVDIRKHGSGNSGTTNALRVLGTKVGIMTFVLDILKGSIAVLLGIAILGNVGGFLAGVFVVLGHNFPVFLNFKGGKGVATSLGVLFILTWKTALICLIIAALVMALTKYVSLGSILASIFAPIILILTGDSTDKYLLLTTIILALLSIIRHRENIGRLLRGEENKLGNKI